MFFDLETTGFDRPIRPVQVLKILDEGEGTVSKRVLILRTWCFKAQLNSTRFADPKVARGINLRHQHCP